MKKEQILINKTSEKVYCDLIEQLAESCYIDVLTGRFHCKKCHNIVYIDLSRRYAFCPEHGMLI